MSFPSIIRYRQSGLGNEKIIIRAKEYIEQNLGFHLTLESVAEHVNFSPAYFSKFFKNEEGLNFIDYVNKVRIEEAKRLLDQNVKTADICDKIGFADVKHFYKTFKKWEGITPGQYKKG
ncbi:helix-turn-helix domain-containing protein [Robinsoniella peoriensis]|uniref:helix-turn-helix domain-containing protein n=1 Tax=Robinsoniella peoriensis TaxID=180332 RepID=UPI0037538CC9